jgi:integrase/recombinase XerC/integrase/recombinase XerD
MRPASVSAYYRILQAFLNFCVAEGYLPATPLRRVKGPRVPLDQVRPLTSQQVQALIDSARRSRNAHRDATVILVLLDTGLRVSELCSVTVGDVEYGNGEIQVVGKGAKRRSVYLGRAARRAVWGYLEICRRGAAADEPLFTAVSGPRAGAGLTPSGVHQLVAGAGRRAGLRGVRCSPHTLRHTFAISFLRNGGNVFELQQLMGHSDLTVLRRYVALAEADIADAHRRSSPVDQMHIR